MNHLYSRSLLFLLANATLFLGLYTYKNNRYHSRYQHSPSQDHFQDSFTATSNSRALIDINENDEVEESLQLYLAELQKKNFSREDDIIEINSYWHIFSPNGTEGDFNDDLIKKQFEILNGAYAGNISNFNPCFDSFTYDESTMVKTPFRFVLKEIIRYPFESEPSLFSSERYESRRGDCSDLNIYSGYTSKWPGESTFPWDCQESIEKDGVAIRNIDVLGGKTSPEGDALVLLVGHWLGLFETSEDGCEGNDFVLDTSPQKFSFDCPIGINTCGGAGRDPIHNYMNKFVDDCCKYRFTNGQTERMILAAGLYRNLTGNVSLPEVSLPICGFPEDGFNYSECKVDDPCIVRNGECDSSYNTSECNYDGRDCLCEYPIDGFDYSLCGAEFPCQIGDGECNDELDTEECNFDYLECFTFEIPYDEEFLLLILYPFIVFFCLCPCALFLIPT